jgi:hypothetical protein
LEGVVDLSGVVWLVVKWAVGDDGYKVISKAGVDAVIAKIGWVNQYWTTRRNQEGEWVVESFDPFMVMFDPDGRKLDQSDWRYMDISGMYSAEEIIALHRDFLTPEQVEKIRAAAERLEGTYSKISKPKGWADRVYQGALNVLSGGAERRILTEGLIDEWKDARNGLYRVVEFHDRRTVTEKFRYNPVTRETVRVEDLPGGTADAEGNPSLNPSPVGEGNILGMGLAPEGEFAGWITDEVSREEMWKTAICPALLQDEELFEMPYKVQGRGFQHKAVFCYDFHPDLTKAASVVDALISPSDSYNQTRMSLLEYLMRAVNPDWLVPKGSIDPLHQAVWESNDRGKMKEFTPIGMSGLKPEREAPLIQGAGLQTFSEMNHEIIQQISGINPNMQGRQESSKESGVLYAQRVQQGQMMLMFFFGHLQDAMKELFGYCFAGMQKHLTTPRKLRLLDDESNPEWLAVNWPTVEGIMNDITAGEYDFKPDFAQLGQTAKQMKFYEALEFVKTVPPELVDWTLLFELWDSPVAKRMKSYAERMMGQQQMQRMQEQEMAVDRSGLEIMERAKMLVMPEDGKGAQGKRMMGGV